ncbi:hypothetical protein [Candidatus Nitrotoga arctica]|uniref:hypothetical protein n=1 Tax=Candidatus Nitrotoga arctica TaxID=453162 RepID=UPI001EFA9417|nr:hypothetical protein [Candidatus Nitrotoga arctica]
MDASEKLVQDHLHHRDYVDVVYEPDGNVAPDFLVNGAIAIEVRRLNQNHFGGPNTKGLEEAAIPLWNQVKDLLSSMGAPTKGESWFVHFEFNRPVERWKTLRKKLRSALAAFAVATKQERAIIAKGRNFELEVFCRTSKPHATMFVMAGYTDKESGGWLLAEMETNIRYCARKKEEKISKVRSKYPEWWLLIRHKLFMKPRRRLLGRRNNGARVRGFAQA